MASSTAMTPTAKPADTGFVIEPFGENDEYARLMLEATELKLKGEEAKAKALTDKAVAIDMTRALEDLMVAGVSENEFKLLRNIGAAKSEEEKSEEEKAVARKTLEQLVTRPAVEGERVVKVERLWVYKDETGQVFGPLSTSEMHRGFVMGFVTATTLVTRHGADESTFGPFERFRELTVDDSLRQEVLYQELVDSNALKLGRGGDPREIADKAIEAINMEPERAAGYLLLADTHQQCGNMMKAYICYVQTCNVAEEGSFAHAKAALNAYELVTDPTIEDRPEDTEMPEWITNHEQLLATAIKVLDALGHHRQPGAWRMKADALAAMGDTAAADSAYTRARHLLAQRIREIAGRTIGGPDTKHLDVDGNEVDHDPTEPWGSAVAMLEHALGDLSGLCADPSDSELKTPLLPLTNYREPSMAPLAIGGICGRWCGGLNNDEQRDEMQMASGDALGSVPSKRWLHSDIEQPISAVADQCTRHGGFIMGADLFDSQSFNISPAEAGAMDPQQRLLLEHGFTALHQATWRRVDLMGGDTGVFLGIERPDWSIAQPPEARASVYSVTGDNVSAAAGRIAFVLGLQGPCNSVDTACASALTSLHSASSAVRNGECGGSYGGGKSGDRASALSVAVSLKLVPHGMIGAASAGMLSTDGRCKTLDNRANGYARAESVGAICLRPYKDPTGVAEPPFEPLVAGSQVRQDGRSASLTAPNGTAQRTLHSKTLAMSSIAASEIGWVEMHGTGTALGDPTETGAIAKIHDGRMKTAGEEPRRQPLVVMAAKGNCGHAEAPSGFVGVLKIYHLMLGSTVTSLPGNCHLRDMNPMVREAFTVQPVDNGEGGKRSVTFTMATQRTLYPILDPTCTVHAGVSSFGYSGTISHAVMRHCTYDEPFRAEGPALRRIEKRFLKQWGMSV